MKDRNALKLFVQFEKMDGSIAIIDGIEKFSFNDLLIKVAFFEKEIAQLQIQKGETVMLISDYSFESISLFLAMFKFGLIIVPVTTQNETEINERLKVCGTCTVFNLRSQTITKQTNISSHSLINQIKIKEESGLILFSSGSSGAPKAMVHNLDNLINNYLDKRGKSLIFMVFLMFDHIGGLNTLLNCLAMGSTIVIPKSRKPIEVAQLIQDHKINILPASPTFLNLMLIARVKENFDLNTLKMITYGTEPMPESLLKKLKMVFPRVKFLQTFGTSETGIIKTTSLSSESTYLKFDDSSQEYKIVNNELWLRSSTQVLGYLNHSNDSFTEDGWFMTGDMVEVTENGFIKISGRLKEVINVGGEKVLPSEVESVIMEIDSVQDCLVRPEKNIITGQAVCVEVVLKSGFVFSEEKLKIKNYCKKNLDNYKVPVRIIEVESLSISNRFKKSRN